MANAAVNALNSLLRGTRIEDHEEALKLANGAIQAARASSGAGEQLATAQHTKVVALLKLDRFDDALRAVAEGGDALATRCVLERAYALYKTGELAEAETLLKADERLSSSSSSISISRALKHVAAQVAYRAEKFGRVASLYGELSEGGGNGENDDITGEALDLRINTLATAAQVSWLEPTAAGARSNADVGRRQDLETFETAYNAGSALLAGGDAARASVLLRRAQQLCEASEELSDDDKRAELLPILVQQAYALTRLGRHGDAAALHRGLGQLIDVDEGATKAVAQINNVVVGADDSNNTETNPYAVQAKMAAIGSPPSAGSDRLFGHQARVMRHNQLALELQCFKFKGVQTRTARQLKKQVLDSDLDLASLVDLGLFHAAAKAGMQTGNEALRRLQPLLEDRPGDVGLLLTTLQLHLRQNKNPAAAVGLLEAFFAHCETPCVRFAPGLVALAVALYRLQGRHGAVRTELAAAVAHWQLSTTDAPASLLRAAGVELLRSPDPADQAVAATAFGQLHAADPTDRVAVAGLVAAAATTSPSSALSDHHRQLAASLTPVDKLVQGVDVDRLLQGGVAVLAPAATATAPAAAAAAAAAKKRSRDADETAANTPLAKKAKTPATLSRQARKLQAKDAATFDAAKTPDAERWLPLRDRSSYRPPKGKKGGRRRGADAATMQGGVVREEETLALAGGAGSVKVEKASVLGPGGNSAAKKRKKGKK
ncbi:signal recognition particle [Grosmannia clavigera kw1407]|uniref:Signal recognition particle subunit SRP72 n=1 Tax=Grosmannia clavigera (strain kw1407 / UAMH 11150) TaxID=655863 RepID=F0XMC2_GROCL|nr:signal recognition particle [Grosmannia clavigera kw1407]EFX01135.1 signal recognition particle [Grosmannia clavigera kw1407]